MQRRKRRRIIVAVLVTTGLLPALALSRAGRSGPLAAVHYFVNAPERCAACHVMKPAYETWACSAHKTRASCNDCHIPHDARHPLAQAAYKARLAAARMYAIAKRDVPPTIQITENSRTVVQGNCLRCHGPAAVSIGRSPHAGIAKVYCFTCHQQHR